MADESTVSNVTFQGQSPVLARHHCGWALAYNAGLRERMEAYARIRAHVDTCKALTTEQAKRRGRWWFVAAVAVAAARLVTLAFWPGAYRALDVLFLNSGEWLCIALYAYWRGYRHARQ